jgi:DNA-3-methyladenine glycosylase I
VPRDDARYLAYHDTEWGFPSADDRALFEKLCLEGFQAGLSWRTVLHKRQAFRAAFAGFEIDAVAGFGQVEVQRLLQDEGIIRHKGKITAAIANARVAADLRCEFGSLAALLWEFAPADAPADHGEAAVRARTTSPEAAALAAFLRGRGWRFLGPTSAYAFMQSVGMVNDHVEHCPVRARVERALADFVPPTSASR